METIILIAKIIFLLSLIFTIIYGFLMSLILWRFSLSKPAAIFFTSLLGIAGFFILGHALIVLTRL